MTQERPTDSLPESPPERPLPPRLDPAHRIPPPWRRPVAWLCVVASLAVLAFGLVTLTRFMQEFNRGNPRPVFAFERVNQPEFTFAGRPVEIEEVQNVQEPVLALRYDEAEAILPVSIPPEYPDLPGLLPHENWMRIFRFIEATGISKAEAQQRLEAGEERLVVVTRNLRPGADPQSWGQVWRRDWTFTFYELLPEGGFDVTRLDFPESKRAYDRRVRAARAEGRPDPERSPTELKQGTWPFEMALQVMPPGAGPSMIYEDDALSAAGWRLHLCIASALALTVSLLVALAPRGRKKEAAREVRAA